MAILANVYSCMDHFFFECDDFLQTRNKYYQANNMKQLFQDKHNLIIVYCFLGNQSFQ